MPVFTSGIVLLLSIWGGKRSGLFMDPDKEIVDVHKCMKALKASEDRSATAGRLWYAVSLNALPCSKYFSLGIFCTNSPALESCLYPNLVLLQEQKDTTNRTLCC